MSVEELDLNIESYSILDLLDYFNVPKTANKEQLLNNYNTKKEKINKIKNETTKKELLVFLEKAHDFVKKYFISYKTLDYKNLHFLNIVIFAKT